MPTLSSNKLIAKNTIFLYIRMFFVLIVSLYTSRVILNTLGVQDYGIRSVVAGFVSLFGFFNTTLASSIQRFYNYEESKNGAEGFSQVYTIGIIIHIIIGFILLLLLETFGLWYINSIMVLPQDRMFATNIIFQTSIISMLLVLFQIPFVGAIMAKERMNFYAIVSIINVSLNLIIVLLLPHINSDKLITYGIMSLIISIIDFMMYYTFCRNKFHEMRFKNKYNPSLFKSILHFSGWNLIGTFALMLKGQGINMILNLFFGPIINTARGIAVQVQSAISTFSQNITIAFRPQIVNSYALMDYSRVKQLMFTESRVCFMLLGAIVAPLIVNIDYILYTWLGPSVPQNTNVFTCLILIDQLICTLNTPCSQVVYASGKIKHYQIGSSLIYITLIPVSWFLLKNSMNPYVVFIATIAASVINQIVCLFITNKIFKFEIKNYLKKVLLPCFIFTAILLPILYALSKSQLKQSFILLLCAIVDIIMVIPMGYYLGFNKEEQTSIRNFITEKLINRA